MTDPKKILVIQLRRIGDVILTTPAVAALKKAFPGVSIDFLVEPPSHEILEGCPDLDHVIVYRSQGWLDAARWVRRIRARRYDWVVDFMGNPRTAILTAGSAAVVRAGPAHVAHRWAYNRPLIQSPVTCYAGLEKVRWLKALGVHEEDTLCLPRLHLPGIPEYREGGDRPVGFAPASRKETRQWPVESFIKLGKLLRERHGLRVLVFWGPAEEALAGTVARGIGDGARTAPETPTLREAAGLIAGCRLLVTNCNGPKHIAVALGVPTVTIHGSSDPASWTPPHPRHIAVREESLSCIACGLNRCPTQRECLTGLSAEKVLSAAEDLLELTGKPVI